MVDSNVVQVLVATGDSLDVRAFAVRRRIDELFRIELTVVSPNPSIALADVIGNAATFTIGTDLLGGMPPTLEGASLELSRQVLNGICIEMRQVRAEETGVSTYELVLVPRAWLLTQRKNYRIFQYVSELDIVRRLLGEWGIEHDVRTTRTYTPRKYRVQYDESDFAFVCRMLEDAGIAFYFESSGSSTVMVLDDEPQARAVAHPALPFYDQPTVHHAFVTRLSIAQAARPGKMTIGDLDYRRPSTLQPRLTKSGGLPQESALEQFDYEPGAFLYAGQAGGHTVAADDRGSARTDEQVGSFKTENRLRGKRHGEKVVRFDSNVTDLAPGSIVGVIGHPHHVVSASMLLVTSTTLAGRHNELWRVRVECVSTNVPYRPATRTSKPKVAGLESATVVGPAGEEIHTDEYGRVRVHFHWDREGERNETSSCWLPTSQPWAGTGFGGINLPRIGQEVLVDFLGGDPDRPVVLGRVYTETSPPPDKLPDHKTISGIMSESTPRLVMGAADASGAGQESSLLGDGHTMSTSELNDQVTQPGTYQASSPTGSMHGWSGSGIKFEDSLGKEMVYLQAQRDCNIRVNNCWRTIVGAERACMVGTDDVLEIGNQHHVTIMQNQTVTIGGNQTLNITKNRKECINGKLTLDVGAGGFHVDADDTINIDAAKLIVIQAKNRLKFVVKGSSIEMLPDHIIITCPTGVYFQPLEDGHPKSK